MELLWLFLSLKIGCDVVATPQLLKSQSLIPFPRVGRSRSSFLQSMGSSGGGGGSSEGGGNGKPNMALANWGNGQQLPVKNNVNKVIRNWNLRNNVDLRSEIKRHLIPFPRVGKRQSLIPFPRVGRSRFFPNDDDEGVQQSAEDSSTSMMNANDASGSRYISNTLLFHNAPLVFVSV